MANASGNKAMICLRLIGGEEEPRVRRLKLPCTVGRLTSSVTYGDHGALLPASNNAIFRSEYLSRRHAEFFCDPTGQVYIKDLNSSNGTFLNGMQLKGMQPTILQENDIVQFGTEDEDLSKESVVIVQVQLSSSGKSAAGANSNSQNVDMGNYYAKSPSTASNNYATNHSPPIYNKVSRRQKDDINAAAQQRVTDVMRRLSSLGMQLSNITDKSALHERLAILEDAVDLCMDQVSPSSFSLSVSGQLAEDDDATIYTHPNVPSALRIIGVYETIFLLLAATFVYMLSSGYTLTAAKNLSQSATNK